MAPRTQVTDNKDNRSSCNQLVVSGGFEALARTHGGFTGVTYIVFSAHLLFKDGSSDKRSNYRVDAWRYLELLASVQVVKTVALNLTRAQQLRLHFSMGRI